MKRKIQPILTLLLPFFLLQVGLAQDPVTFNASTHTKESGDAVEVNVSVENFTNVISAQFTIEFDSTVLDFATVGNYGLTYMASSSFGKPPELAENTMTFVWYDESLQGITVDDNSTIFTITFEVIGMGGDSSSIAFESFPTMIEITDLNGVVSADFNPGYVKVAGAVSVSEIITDAFTFYPIYPNPVKEMANLRFDLKEKENYSISVYDLSGKIVFEQSETLPAGEHLLEVPGHLFPASGNYFCRLEVGEHIGIQKLLLTR